MGWQRSHGWGHQRSVVADALNGDAEADSVETDAHATTDSIAQRVVVEERKKHLCA